MKKSFMSISMLVVSISMVAMFVCSCAANAHVASSKFIYDKKENAETVFTLDQTGKYLTPKVKYEYSENGKTKTAFQWSTETEEWSPSYQMVYTENEKCTVIEFAAWNKQTKTYSLNQQKAVYNKDLDNDVLSYVFYQWNPSAHSWEISQNLLLQDYLATTVDSIN